MYCQRAWLIYQRTNFDFFSVPPTKTVKTHAAFEAVRTIDVEKAPMSILISISIHLLP